MTPTHGPQGSTNRRSRTMRVLATVLPTHVLMLCLAGCGADSGTRASDIDQDGIADSADCAPQLAAAWQLLDFASRDEDSDSFRVNAGGRVCTGATLPPNRFASAASSDSVDCDDSDATKWSTRSYAGIDSDHDGHSVAASGQFCTGAARPAGFIAELPPSEELDCDDADSEKWHLSHFLSRDGDGDGHGVAEAGTFCGQGSLPAGLSADSTPAPLLDCDDTDGSRWRLMATYRDADGDGVGSGSASTQCIGKQPHSGYALTGYDPLDDRDDPLALSTSTFDLDAALLTPPDDVDDDDIFP